MIFHQISQSGSSASEGSLSVGMSVRSTYRSTHNYSLSDTHGHDGRNDFGVYEFTGYGYDAQSTKVVDVYRGRPHSSSEQE